MGCDLSAVAVGLFCKGGFVLNITSKETLLALFAPCRVSAMRARLLSVRAHHVTLREGLQFCGLDVHCVSIRHQTGAEHEERLHVGIKNEFMQMSQEPRNVTCQSCFCL